MDELEEAEDWWQGEDDPAIPVNDVDVYWSEDEAGSVALPLMLDSRKYACRFSMLPGEPKQAIRAFYRAVYSGKPDRIRLSDESFSGRSRATERSRLSAGATIRCRVGVGTCSLSARRNRCSMP
ncbi:hypothetical protein [Oricola sp.]|uniref:hypothetical protein n=1 Tax=Oricola sp. TaxID=1979950 RepID=UPI0025DBCE09|nr:hypothetical protein [Oricola sp.]MCI5076625.1 hypothetical protein [Oricola sp.]